VKPRVELLFRRALEVLDNYRDLHTKWCSKFPLDPDGKCRCGGSEKLADQIRKALEEKDDEP
jgi:hypothetical protein